MEILPFLLNFGVEIGLFQLNYWHIQVFLDFLVIFTLKWKISNFYEFSRNFRKKGSKSQGQV